jgi:D-alanyl-D-alanine carboxypeptidase
MKLRAEAAKSLEKLFAAAKHNGTPLRLSSAYRSYVYQVSLYSGYVAKEGQGAADAESARPGYSEHQTGLAVDVGNVDGACEVERCFGDSPAGQWVAANAYKYGYIVRYPNGLTDVTGYEYEPWHLRYVGVDLAAEMHKMGTQTLEQFFGLDSAPDY